MSDPIRPAPTRSWRRLWSLKVLVSVLAAAVLLKALEDPVPVLKSVAGYNQLLDDSIRGGLAMLQVGRPTRCFFHRLWHSRYDFTAKADLLTPFNVAPNTAYREFLNDLEKDPWGLVGPLPDVPESEAQAEARQKEVAALQSLPVEKRWWEWVLGIPDALLASLLQAWDGNWVSKGLCVVGVALLALLVLVLVNLGEQSGPEEVRSAWIAVLLFPLLYSLVCTVLLLLVLFLTWAFGWLAGPGSFLVLPLVWFGKDVGWEYVKKVREARGRQEEPPGTPGAGPTQDLSGGQAARAQADK